MNAAAKQPSHLLRRSRTTPQMLKIVDITKSSASALMREKRDRLFFWRIGLARAPAGFPGTTRQLPCHHNSVITWLSTNTGQKPKIHKHNRIRCQSKPCHWMSASRLNLQLLHVVCRGEAHTTVPVPPMAFRNRTTSG